MQRAGRERQQIRCDQLIPRPMTCRRRRLRCPHRTIIVAYQQANARSPGLQQGIDALQPLGRVAQRLITTHLLILRMQRQLLCQRAGDLRFAPALFPPALGIALPFRLGPRRRQRGAAIAVRRAQPRLPGGPDRGLQAGRILREQATAAAAVSWAATR